MSEITREMRDAANKALAQYEASKGTQVVEESDEEEPYCDHCQSYVAPEDYREDDLMCQGCHDECHVACSKCGEQTWSDDAKEGMCEACYQEACDELDAIVELIKDGGTVLKAIKALKKLR